MAARILIVDDNALYRLVLGEMLTGDGYLVASAADGEAGLEAVRGEKPELVLLDVQMPRMDGLEVCRRIKSDPETRHIPVLMFSGLSAAEDRKRVLAAGADGFLGKPAPAAELFARVKILLSSRLCADEVA